jgi:hypothetical protein
MIRRPRRDGLTERDIAALADGSLAPERREYVERAVASSPKLQADVREQRLAVSAVHAAATARAPAALRARVAYARPSRRPARRIGALAVAGAAAIAATVVLALGGGTSATPSVADAAVLAMRPPTSPVSQPTDGRPTLRAPRAAGLPFPYWEDHFGWTAIGQRHDRLGGRPATTVFYRHDRQVIAYTIVGGEPLPAGAPARASMRDGTVLRGLAVHGRNVVTWLRRGHTCVLSGARTADAALQRLAVWRGGGDIPS